MSDRDDIRSEIVVDPMRPGASTRSRETRLRQMHVARADGLYLLRNTAGEYLHMSASGVTTVRAWAWIGSWAQLRRLRGKGDYSQFRAVAAE